MDVGENVGRGCYDGNVASLALSGYMCALVEYDDEEQSELILKCVGLLAQHIPKPVLHLSSKFKVSFYIFRYTWEIGQMTECSYKSDCILYAASSPISHGRPHYHS